MAEHNNYYELSISGQNIDKILTAIKKAAENLGNNIKIIEKTETQGETQVTTNEFILQWVELPEEE